MAAACSAPLTLGNYPNTTVSLGSETTITPEAAPANATGIDVSTSTDFKGTFAADPATGVVRATNAHPAGTYTVTVTALGGAASTSATFDLTVQQGTLCAGTPSFTNSADVGAGHSPQSVAVGDFNNDGKQDIAIANSGSNTVSIRLGDGAGGFSGTTNVSVDSNPYSVAIGDFNNDGKQDIATTNGGSATVSIRLGDGLGGFTGTTNLTVGSIPNSVAIGDFNNDGKQDIAVANYLSGTVSIYLGDGLGGFTGTTNVNAGTTPYSVAIGDFNNDGKQDLAVANLSPGTVSIRLGNGAGGFSGTTNVSVGTTPYSVAIGDFNSDGKQDIAVANVGSNNVSIRLGDGAGNFTGTTNVDVGAQPALVAIGDFNNDGKQDFAAANVNSKTVSIRLGDGAGNFSGTTEVGVGLAPYSVAIGDFNNDGKQDVATANLNSNNVSVRLGGCNLSPTISAANGLSRTQGSPASTSQVASVTDDGGAALVGVAVTSANPSNGVTISNIANVGGQITANIVADCTASNASFTLQASDGASASTAILNVTVNGNTAPTLTYTNPPALAFNGSTTVTPATATDNGSITGYSVQSVLPALTTVPTMNSSGVVSITNAQPAGAHTITIRAIDNCGAVTDSSFTLTVNRGDQTITFGALANKTFGDPDFSVSATATSGLPVNLAASGNCTVTSPSPGTIHIVNGGSCTITASQAGDANYNPAPDVPQSFTINKASQTINFGSLANKPFGDPDFSISATSSSGLAVSFSAGGSCTVDSPSPGMVHLKGAGSCTITTSQAGNIDYLAAANVPQSFTINKGNQTITFAALANKTFSDPDFDVSGTATSGLPVSFAASGNCTVTSPSPGTVHLVNGGSCTITASQAGDANYNPAPYAPQSFTINKANQSITFAALASKTFSDPDFLVSASSSSGLSVSFSASGIALSTLRRREWCTLQAEVHARSTLPKRAILITTLRPTCPVHSISRRPTRRPQFLRPSTHLISVRA